MTSIWNFLEETPLAGKYRVHALLGESEGAAFFRATYGAEQQALLKIVMRTSSEAAEAQLEQWRTAVTLTHPNLLRLLDYGSGAEDDGNAFLYALFEFPDDLLVSALERGPLTAQETRDVLVAALEGLAYIHSQGLVHGAIDASHVVAVGNQIKLSSDTLRLPSRETTTAGDIRLLGALVYQLTTGRRVEPGLSPDLAPIEEPFRTVIEHSLAHDRNRRWSLLQIAAAAHPKPQPTISPVKPPLRPRPVPMWILAATPAFLVAVILLLRGVKPKPEVPAALTPAAQVPVAFKPAPSRSWRVIAYTYARRAPAEKRAESINRTWSGAQAQVLESGGPRHGTFLIALGGPMNRDDAVRFLKIARDRGMPRSTALRANLP